MVIMPVAEEPNILIKSALDSVVQYINGGSNPTDALQKVAEEFDLNHNYIHRVGNALNVALTYDHFKKAEDRSTDFPIADIPAVVKKQYTVKDASEKKQISEQFSKNASEAESPDFVKIMYRPNYKEAYVKIATAIEEDRLPTAKHICIKSANYISKLEKELDHAKTEKVGAELGMNSAFAGMVNTFSRSQEARTPFEEFESQVFSKYGEESVPYLDFIYKSAGLKEDRGVHDKHYTFFDLSKEASMFDKFMTSTEEFKKNLALEKEASDLIKFEKAHVSDMYQDYGLSKLAEFEEGSTEGPISNPVPAAEEAHKSKTEVDPVMKKIQENIDAKKKSEELDKQADESGSWSKRFLAKKIEEAFASKESPKKNNFSASPLENIERQALVQDLIITDPILKKTTPQKVVHAYEQIIRLAPQLSLEKDVVRGLLRQLVEAQALSDYDADRLTQADINRMKQKQLQRGGNNDFSHKS